MALLDSRTGGFAQMDGVQGQVISDLPVVLQNVGDGVEQALLPR